MLKMNESNLYLKDGKIKIKRKVKVKSKIRASQGCPYPNPQNL